MILVRGRYGLIEKVKVFVGAFFVLYSTCFVSTASLARVLTDLRRVGTSQAPDTRLDQSWISVGAVVLPIAFWALAAFWPDRPVLLVTVGAVGQALTLPPIAGALLAS